MRLSPLPEEVEHDLRACLQCGYCNFVCPIQLNPDRGFESYRVRGKMYHLKRYVHPGLTRRLLVMPTTRLPRRSGLAMAQVLTVRPLTITGTARGM